MNTLMNKMCEYIPGCWNIESSIGLTFCFVATIVFVMKLINNTIYFFRLGNIRSYWEKNKLLYLLSAKHSSFKKKYIENAYGNLNIISRTKNNIVNMDYFRIIIPLRALVISWVFVIYMYLCMSDIHKYIPPLNASMCKSTHNWYRI